MLEFLYRKIVNNKWLFICLFIGALLASGILSSIPLYSNAILQKVLTRDLENDHMEKKVSPGMFTVSLTGSGMFEKAMADQVKDIAERQLHTGYHLPVEEQLNYTKLNPLTIKREGDDYFNKQRVNGSPVALSGYDQKIELIQGRHPQNDAVNGVYEVAVSLEGMNKMRLLWDQEYILEKNDYFNDTTIQIARFKVVGVFSVQDTNTLYWSGGRYRELSDSIIFSEDQIGQLLNHEEQVTIKNMECTCFFDYRSVKIEDTDRILKVSESQYRWNNKNGNLIKLTFPMLKVLESYKDRKLQLTMTLWILTIPMMLIICFYTMLISNLIVKNSRNEIAVLKSRGAGRLQIFLLYLAESLILSMGAFFAGPHIGSFICRVLGSSNGFLEFINRKTLVPEMTREVYGYAFLAVLVFMLFMLVPVVKASTAGIVEYKRSLTSGTGKPFWQKFYLDFLVLALCGYGYYQFRNRQDILGLSALSGTELSVDPLLFFISTFFILGISLLFLRVYPMAVRLIFKLGNRWWNPVAYFSLVNVSRADRNQQSIMLFIILSLSFGIINANQARTINSNVTDKIMYKNGAEVVVEPYNNLKHTKEMEMPGTIEDAFFSYSSEKAEYKEPPYEVYQKINGYESITRVLVDKRTSLTSGRETVKNMKLMAITPYEFGQTAWFRRDLLSHHINEYLNLLTKAPTAALLSGSIRDDFGIRKGDQVYIRTSMGSLECVVYGFLDYFPSCHLYEDEKTTNKAYFAIINHSYVMEKLPAAPYEIWMKKKPGVTDGAINDELKALNLTVERVDFASQEIIGKKNDPVLLGTNGVLTMCFIVTMGIAAIGFVIFWILSIREKTLKFGIFRAMGMPMRSITQMILSEQGLVSVTSIVIGIILGSVASQIFIPMLEMVYSAYQQVPPFIIIADKGDYVKVLEITGMMLFIGLILLYGLVRRINVHQVIKMGEDS